MRKLSDNQHNVAYVLEHDEQNVLEYWTPERVAGAIPIPLPAGPERETGPASGPSSTPATDPEKADLSKMPFSAGGKLYFSIGEQNYVASAQVFIHSKLILTAAHCVQEWETGKIVDNLMFERCHHGSSYAERLSIKTVALKSYWCEEKDKRQHWQWDYALMITTQVSSSRLLSFSTESAVGQKVTDMGYPTNHYDGEVMVYIQGQPEAMYYNTHTMTIEGGSFGGGCSGGAWLLGDSSTVVGVNSYGPASNAYIGSPVLDGEFDSLCQYALSLT